LITNNQDELKLPPHITFLQGLICDLEEVTKDDIEKIFDEIENSRQKNEKSLFIDFFWNIKTKKVTIVPVVGETYYIGCTLFSYGYGNTYIKNIRWDFWHNFELLQTRLMKEIKTTLAANYFEIDIATQNIWGHSNKNKHFLFWNFEKILKGYYPMQFLDIGGFKSLLRRENDTTIKSFLCNRFSLETIPVTDAEIEKLYLSLFEE
jgi:hypothetical protein